ncbi:MAG: hypothetical protein NZ521_01275 [Flammeovirgaceae bacterium]|nr:hypothetical protein [Flammeovirgaceae bacterium]MDW8286607.1 hypothetical protein [Flammeovirgaceae bacterium]
MRKFILFELNEVPFFVIDHYCQHHPESLLAKILPQCYQVETYTEDEGHLSPWITWPTLHRGVTNKYHKIKDFGEDFTEVDAKYPNVWQITMENGISTGVFMPMHSFPLPANYEKYAFFVPDPFAGESKTHPANLIPFQRFNLSMSRRSARNVDSGIDLKSASALALSLPRLGIKASTLMDVAGQLVKERLKPWIRTRRRTYQSVLAFDIFMHLMRRKKPQFAIYFSNHVASAMHRYWAAAFPEQYQKYNLSEEWKKTYKGEIDFAMSKFDEFLGKMLSFVNKNPEYKLIVASSMGQGATEAEQVSTESYCKDFDKFVGFFGLNPTQWERKSAMHPQYNLTIKDERQVEPFAAALRKLEIGGKPLQFRQKEHGFFSIDLGHRNLLDDIAVFDGKKVPFSELGLTNEAIEDETGSTAYHIPEGSLIIYDPQNTSLKKQREKGVTTTAIVPSLLENFKIPVPSYMSEKRIKGIIA